MSDVYHIKKVVRCSIENCVNEAETMGMCANHYRSYRLNKTKLV